MVAGSSIPAASMDHVWANERVPAGRPIRRRLPPRRPPRPAPRVAGRPGGGGRAGRAAWASVDGRCRPGRPSAVPGRDVRPDRRRQPCGIRQPLEPMLQEARRLCRSTGSLLIGSHAGLLERLRPSGSRRREGAVVLTALPSLRRPAFLLRPDDPEPVRYFVRRVAFAHRQPGGPSGHASIRQAASRIALAAPPRLAIRGQAGSTAPPAPGARSWPSWGRTAPASRPSPICWCASCRATARSWPCTVSTWEAARRSCPRAGACDGCAARQAGIRSRLRPCVASRRGACGVPARHGRRDSALLGPGAAASGAPRARPGRPLRVRRPAG
jgi:hypothetical protein